MIFLCSHGQREGRNCWQCGGKAMASTVTGFGNDDVLRYVAPRLRMTAQQSLLDRMDDEHKAQLIVSLTRP